jgi:hypothetical protein
MYYLIPSRSLLQGVMAGALVLAGAGACARPDQSESGSNTAAIGQDTTLAGASTTTTGMDTVAGSDTLTAAGSSIDTGGAAGDTAPARLESDAPRAATATPSAERNDTSIQPDTSAAGYRAMESDTAGLPAESDSARVTEDTSEISQLSVDTAAVETAGAVPPQDTISTEVAAAQDTAPQAADTVTIAYSDTATGYADTALATADTGAAIQANVDTAEAEFEVTADGRVSAGVAVADTSGNAGRIRPPEDSTEILGQVTTDTTVAAEADTISDRVRPPEDSTELRGNVDVAETADEEPVDPAEQEISEDRDAAGAAAIETNVTGSEAVALMTRQGARCSIVDPESDEEVRWDMSSTPVTLNPCGLGSMVLSRIWVER